MLRWLSGEVIVSARSHSVEEAGMGEIHEQNKGTRVGVGLSLDPFKLLGVSPSLVNY